MPVRVGATIPLVWAVRRQNPYVIFGLYDLGPVDALDDWLDNFSRPGACLVFEESSRG
jgi:hypothetical protein